MAGMSMLQTQQTDSGKLKINITSTVGSIPVENATIDISYTGDPTTTIERLTTNANGQTETIDLPSPPLEYSMEPQREQPYSEYNFSIQAEEYEPITISGAEILPNVTAIQNVAMTPIITETSDFQTFVIGPHTLYGDYPPKIAEPEIKPITGSGEIVLSRVVVPEYIIVHDGSVNDNTAPNYYIRYKDYIKNVASCEIYATWPESTIQANVLAIMSFTLNRVYTEWYRNK